MPDYRLIYERAQQTGWFAGQRSMTEAGRTEWDHDDFAAAVAASAAGQPRRRTVYCYLDGYKDGSAGRPRDETGGRDYLDGYAKGWLGEPI